MSLYEAAKDALKLAQKSNDLEMIQRLLDVQQQALEMQEKQLMHLQRIEALETEVKELNENKKYVFANNENYLIDPEFPSRALCPMCTIKNRAPIPLIDSEYCSHCKASY